MKLALIVHNVRSCHNVGSLLRTADGLGVEKVYLTGYTPWPAAKNDERLPHLAQSINRRIHKSALGAEDTVAWERYQDLSVCLQKVKNQGYKLVALEQTAEAVDLVAYQPSTKIALLVGPEVEGLKAAELSWADGVIHIPMKGHKESFNVAVAAAMALYRLSQF